MRTSRLLCPLRLASLLEVLGQAANWNVLLSTWLKEEKKLWQVVLQHSGIAKNKSGVHSSRILLNRMCHPRIKATTAKCQNLQLERMLRVATYLVEVSCSTSQPSESITLITLHCMMRRLALKQTRRLLLRMKLARNLRLGLSQGRLPTHKRKTCENQIPRP